MATGSSEAGAASRSSAKDSRKGSNGPAGGRLQGLGQAVLYFGCRRRDQVRWSLC